MTPSAAVSANIPEEGKIFGRAGAGTSKSFRSSSSQAAVRRLKSCVRAALLKSVAWTLPAVRFQRSQLSTVPRQTASIDCPMASIRLSSQRALLAEKSGSMVSPVRSRRRDSRPCSRRCWQKSAVRRHCQITAGPSGRPFERSHARIVSRWLEIPMAASLSEEIWLTQSSTTVCTAFQMASGSCSTHPGCGKAISIGTEALATILASRSMTTALVFDVPWSMARRKSCGIVLAMRNLQIGADSLD